MPKIAFLFIIFLSISKALLADAQPVTLQDNNDYYEIGLNLNILEDPTGKLKIEDVNSPKYQKKFKKSQDKIPNFGFSTSSFWIKIIVNNKSQKKDWLFSYNYYNQDKITFFKKIGNAWEQKTTGDIYTLKTREREERPFVFKVSPKEKTTYFFRIEGTDHQANISLVTEEKFQKLKIKEYIYFSIFSGLVLGLILYNFFIFVSTKSKSYLYYILYLIFFWFFLSLDMGFAQLLFFEKHPWFSNGGIAFFACGACLFGLLFATSYLKIETDLLLFKVLSWGSIFCLVSTLIALIIPFFFSLKIMILNTLFVPITALYAGFYKLKNNYRPAKYFLIAFSTFIFGVIIYTLMIIDLLPNYPFIRNILPFSYSVEIILLSFGLADSFNLIQEEALEKEEKMRKFQQNYAKNLEKEVEERTKEIEEQKNNISNLLNYMSQSVFTIDAGG
ncbi:MAG: 7TM diverse intracellular signaling domain-containing protein, partial [Bdellovibrionota bacterium]|nr:7TM diverse intracellular signaling domain-containing protein [Bdellovibrionota bacterium]